jgi:hypothetical protein
VDEEAVESLDVRPDELEDLDVPARRASSRRRGGLSRDLSAGEPRPLAPTRGRDRVAIPKDELPSPEVAHSRPVSRTYRALVREYFRRLEELSSGE